MIELHAVTKTFASVTALQPTDLRLPREQTTVLIGPSGCGKSTVLRLIAGLIEPTSGEIRVDGSPVTPATRQAFFRRLGYVIQDGGLFPHLSARDNVLLAARELKLPAARMEQRLAELCALTRLEPAQLARYPLELSGGQRQRVSLSRALMLKPDLLLLDEPLGALDPMVRAALLADLQRIFAQLRATVLWVTHDLGEAAHLADHLVLLHSGRIVQQGRLADFEQRPAEPFVRDFFQAQHLLSAGGAGKASQ